MTKLSMNGSLIFLGKFDEDLLHFEESVLNMDVNPNSNSNNNNGKIPVAIKYNKGEMPDVIKYSINGYDYDAWVLIGDVKPTLLLKDLISNVDIILFIFNLGNEETLNFLNEGWKPILDRVILKEGQTQKRFLVGTGSKSNFNPSIEKTKENFKCNDYFQIDSDDGNDLIGRLKELIKDKKKDDTKTTIEYSYSNNNKTATVTKVSSMSKEIYIPRKVNNQQIQYTVTCIGNSAFSNTKVEKLHIPSCLKRVDEFCFENCNSLNEIITNNNPFFSVGKSFFVFKNQKETYNIFALKDFSYNKDKIHLEFSKNDNRLLFISGDEVLNLNFSYKSFSCCQNINYIHFNAKSLTIGCNFLDSSKYIKQVKISSEEINLNKQCFKNCSNLTQVQFENAMKTKIFERVFEGCELLKTIEIKSPAKIELYKDCFLGNQLETIKLSSKDIIIGDRCFMNCTALSMISIEKVSTMKIGPNSFTGCKSLKSIKLQISTNLELGDYCFSKLAQLNTFEIDEINKIILKEGTFEDCSSLKSISFPNSNEVIFAENSIKGCINLKQIELKEKSKVIFSNPFSNDSKYQSLIEIKCSELTINDECSIFPIKPSMNIKTLNIQRSNILDKIEIIKKFSSIENLTIENDDTYTIKSNTLDLLRSLKHLHLKSKSTLTIKTNLFNKHDSLETLNINCSSLNIESNCFNNNKNLIQISILSQQINISPDCFNSTTNLSIIEFNNEEIEIGDKCFNDCQKLSSIILKNTSYIKIGYESFKNCNQATIDIDPPQKLLLNKRFNMIQSNTSGTSYVREISTNKEYRAKSIEIKKTEKDQLSSFFKEILFLLTRIEKDNVSVVPIIGFSFMNFRSKPFPTIFTPYLSGKTLEDAFEENKLTQEQRYSIMIGIANGMKYLHSKSIIHKNLNPSNILLDKYSIPHIVDYSIEPTNITKYTAPEIINEQQYSYETDIYSYSIISYELLTLKHPFSNYTNKDFQMKVSQNNERPDLRYIQNSNIRHFFEICWSSTSSNRPSFNQIITEITKPEFIDEFNVNIEEVNQYTKFYRIKLQNQLSIIRYVRSALFVDNIKPLKVIINDKSSNNQNLKSLKKHFLSDSAKEALYYTINSNNEIQNYPETTAIKNLPDSLSIQYKLIKCDYCIYILCVLDEIRNKIKLNENCFSVALKYIKSIKDTKKEIINYLQLKDITSNDLTIYIYRNKEFVKVDEISISDTTRIPLYVSFDFQKFQKIKSHIEKNIEKKTLP